MIKIYEYAGIGNRNVSDHILKTCKDVSNALSLLGYTCRSGGANGCDSAFSSGSVSNKIFLPSNDIPDLAFTIASRYHPYWISLKQYTRRLMARNSLIILDKDLKELTNTDLEIDYNEVSKIFKTMYSMIN